MKKMWILLLAAALCLAFTACTQTGQQGTSSAEPAAQTDSAEKTDGSAVSDVSPSSGEDNVIDWGAGGDEFGGSSATDGAGEQSSQKTSETPASSDETSDTTESSDVSSSSDSSTQNSNEESSATSEYSRVVK